MTSPDNEQPQIRETFTVPPKRPAAEPAAVKTIPAAAKVAIDTPSVTTPASNDSRYNRIDAASLPSRGLFYEFDALSIRKFYLQDLKKLYRAKATGRFRTIVEVIQATVDRDVNKLTIGDFWYLMYWHRINSYPSSPMDIRFTCLSEEHHDRIKLEDTDPRKLHPSSIQGVVTLNKTNLKINFIEDEEAIAAIVAKVMKDYDLTLFPTRIGDLVENVEMMEELNDLQDVTKEAMQKGGDDPTLALEVATKVAETMDEEWYNDYASLLHPIHGETLRDKRKFLDEYSEQRGAGFELLQLMEEFIALQSHGIVESVTTHCRECGARAEGKISADALNFFPSI